MFDPRSVRIRGPLQAHVQGFWDELLRQGYAPLSARNLLLVAAHVGRWLKANRLGLRELTEDRAAAFLRHRRRQGYTHFCARRGLDPMLLYLRSVGVVPIPEPIIDDSPVGRLVREYATYLERERGLVPSSVRQRTAFARWFIRRERPRLDWERLTPVEITRFVLDRSRRSSVVGRKWLVTLLRSFLRFLHVRGATGDDLASFVPAVAGWRLAAVPQALEARDIARLLASFDRTPVGRRDAAIVRLLVRLGLRAGEVAMLALHHVDWRSGEITVQGKGRHESRLPLPDDVGRALAAYLRHGRPRAAARSLFLRSKAPYGGVRSGTIMAIAQRALRRVGVVAGGAHLLRHTAATQLLRRGASLPEIAHVLRHRHMDTTAIYAKVDLDSLGALVRPWPEVAP